MRHGPTVLFGVTPFLRVPDLSAAIAGFTATRGFTRGFQGGTYAHVFREAAVFRIVADASAVAPKSGGRYKSYVDVENVDGLYAEFQPKRDLPPPWHVDPSCDQEYGQRELAVLGPDGGSYRPRPGHPTKPSSNDRL